MNAGRLLMPALRGSAETGFAHEAGAIDAALALGVGGFIIFGGTAPEVAALTASLEARAGRPLLFGADLERGAGQQVGGLRELPPPRALASVAEPSLVRAAGAITGEDARAVGLDLVFAPVADLDVEPANPIVQTRAFGDDPAIVAACVRAWIEGCQATGALACAKHYPGHGRTLADSHVELPVVADGAAVLLDDELPFVEAVQAGVAAVMVAHVAYPALDPSGLPATLSPRILARLRRRGFDGLLVTDALIMDAFAGGRSEAEAATAAVHAGIDILLYPSDPRAVHDALVRAAASDAALAQRLAESVARVERATARAARARPAPIPDLPGADAVADRVLDDRHAGNGRLVPPLELVVVDDDLGGPYPPGPSDVLAEELARLGVPLGPGGTRVVAVFAEPRGWKGRAGLGAAAARALAAARGGAALVVLFAHPRLAPGEVPVLLAWHRQPLMQRAVARWLARRTR